jgi:hypothetical protein
MSDDPFAPEHDPYRPAIGGRVGRRTALLVVAGVATVACSAATAGCVPTRLACVPGPEGPGEGSCEHRFCRYHRRGPA